ncbi:8886_t:CDS:2 [Diversispora eburnea]|uniref:8886_t:CDS:1 n=1 Tax=Diversispora eburnea TaxID=1213867 RepID=A0A9N8YPV7_9GLOM|nr:8886_t:CDS:2 [Diversispora eburnea]
MPHLECMPTESYRKIAREGYLVHCLVALAFCQKEGKEYINHINADFDDGSFREFPSIAEARRVTGINHIWRVSLGVRGMWYE